MVRDIIKDSKLFLEIIVEDTGAGIEYEDQERLYKLFSFIHDENQLNTSDIGLGLIISDLIVSKFNGKVNFISAPNSGSTFTFTFELYDSSFLLDESSNNPSNQLQLNDIRLYDMW